MTDQEKALSYYRCAATQARTGGRPLYVPSRVRLTRRVCGDGPFCTTTLGPGDYECRSNRLGAVSVQATNGQLLGLRLDEFEPIAWAKNEGITPKMTQMHALPDPRQAPFTSERASCVWRLVRQVWFSPTAKRHFFTKKAACVAEARARIKAKYPSERPEYDECGLQVDHGWCWMDLPRSDVLLKRYARVIFRSLPNAPAQGPREDKP